MEGWEFIPWDVANFDPMLLSCSQRLWEVLIVVTPPSVYSVRNYSDHPPPHTHTHIGCCNRPGHQFRSIWLQNRIHPPRRCSWKAIPTEAHTGWACIPACCPAISSYEKERPWHCTEADLEHNTSSSAVTCPECLNFSVFFIPISTPGIVNQS